MEGEEVAAVDSFLLPEYEAAAYEVEFARATSFRGVPYAPALFWHFDGEQGLWMGVSERYRLYRRALAGDTVRVVERAHRPVAVSAAERDSVVASLEEWSRPGPGAGGRVSGPLDYGRIPAVKPAFRGVVVDDRGHLWVPPRRPARRTGGTCSIRRAATSAPWRCSWTRFPSRASAAAPW